MTKPTAADVPDTIYHSGTMRICRAPGLCMVPENAIGALPVFASRAEAQTDNDKHGAAHDEVGMLQVEPLQGGEADGKAGAQVEDE